MMKRWRDYLISIVFIVLVWQLISLAKDNPVLFPGPFQIVKALMLLLLEKETYQILFQSLLRLILALSAGIFLGVFFGLLAGNHQRIEHLLTPVMSTLRVVPVASLIVVILILLSNTYAIMFICLLVILPLVYEVSKQGVKHIDRELLDASKLEVLKPTTKLWYLTLPLSMPYIKAGMLQSVGLGFKVLIMAEFVAQARTSIGRALYVERIQLQYDRVFAWTLLIVMLAMAIEFGLNRFKPKVSA